MCEKISFRQFEESDGTLCPIEFTTLPFEPKRVFYICGVPKGVERGNHAHYKTQQILVCVRGQILVKLFDGFTNTETLLNPGEAIHIPNMVWDSQKFLTGDDVLLSLASTNYDPADYIADKTEFMVTIVQ